MDYNTAKQVIEEIYDWLKRIGFKMDAYHWSHLSNKISSTDQWYMRKMMKTDYTGSYVAEGLVKLFELDAYKRDHEHDDAIFILKDFTTFGDSENGHLTVTDDVDEIITAVAATVARIFDKLGYHTRLY